MGRVGLGVVHARGTTSADADDARHVLHSLERTREYLQAYFPRTRASVTRRAARRPRRRWSLANPLMPLAWLATAPAARRYVVGWAGRSEMHMLAPDAAATRAPRTFRARARCSSTAPPACTRGG